LVERLNGVSPPDDFLKLSQLALTCSTLGESAIWRDLT